MQFNNSPQAIYLQIVAYVCEKILLKEWPPTEKIQSVRELAVQLEVNPNTVARSYDFLKQQEIIFDKRGVGYFVAEDGIEQAMRYRKQEFADKELPSIFKTMFLLGLEPEDLKKLYEKFKTQITKS